MTQPYQQPPTQQGAPGWSVPDPTMAQTQPHAPYAGQQMEPYRPGASPYAQPVAGPLSHPNETLVLALGICSVTIMQLCGPFAWWLGNKARREMAAEPGRYSTGMVTAGWVMGIIGTVLLALQVVLVVVWVVIMLAALASM